MCRKARPPRLTSAKRRINSSPNSRRNTAGSRASNLNSRRNMAQLFAPVDNTDYSDLNLALKILSFLFPIVGLVLYFVHRNSAPNKASQAGKWAGIGFAVGMILNVLSALG